METNEYLNKKIKILEVMGEPLSPYIGKIGIVTSISTDCDNDIQLWGTWGGIAIYPSVDKFEIMED